MDFLRENVPLVILSLLVMWVVIRRLSARDQRNRARGDTGTDGSTSESGGGTRRNDADGDSSDSGDGGGGGGD